MMRFLHFLTSARDGWSVEGYAYAWRCYKCSKCGSAYYSVFRQYVRSRGSMLESHGSKMWNELAAESLEDTVPIAHCPTCKTPSAQLRDH